MAFYGIPRAGFMDAQSAAIANVLVGNKKKGACIEMINLGMEVLFLDSATIAITGADMQAHVDGQSCPMYETIEILAGSRIKFSSSRSGMISYLAVRGKWMLPSVMDSLSTYTYAQMGGFEGRLLKKGDIINVASKLDNGLSMKWESRPNYDAISMIEMHKGPEWAMLSNVHDGFKIQVRKSPMGNRMGVQLLADGLQIHVPDDFRSQAVVPGMVQCTPSGELIVILQDGQTTGGYPRIGMIKAKELALFNQIKVGQKFIIKLKS